MERDNEQGLTGVQDKPMDGCDNKMEQLRSRRTSKCPSVFDNFQSFPERLCTGQTSDNTTAQARLEMQWVSEVEFQLQKEKDLLESILQHLEFPEAGKLNPLRQFSDGSSTLRGHADLSSTGQGRNRPNFPSVPFSQAPSRLATSSRSQVRLVSSPDVGEHTGDRRASFLTGSASERNALRKQVAETLEVDVTDELDRFRELYRNQNVKPPFTCAFLIRQALIESSGKQLSLKDIYRWFQNNFCYFRQNAGTWKNTVRHNLSMQKCFLRVKTKPTVWTLDEVAFWKLRPRRFGTWGVLYEVPIVSQSPKFLGDEIKASLQAALGENNRGLFDHFMTTRKATSPQEVPSRPTEHRSSMEGVIMGIKQEYV
jgi:forkhead box protein P